MTKLKQMRLDAGLTQKQLAKKCDVSAAYISMIEREKYLPTLGVLQKMAEACGAFIVMGAVKITEDSFRRVTRKRYPLI